MLKQYVIVLRALRMSAGKIASQVAHATFLALEKENKALLNKWKREGMCVIVLQCKTIEQLNGLNNYCETWNIIHHMYVDEGLTEVLPFVPTALATGIIKEDKEWIFRGLELYG